MPPAGIIIEKQKVFPLADLSDPAQNVAFESSFYKAFSKIKTQGLLREIWNWDDRNQRISLKIPAAATHIFHMDDGEGKSLFYVGGNYDPDAFSQFRHFGFEKPAFITKYVEVITLFATEHFNGNLAALAIEFLQPYCYRHAKGSGHSHLLSTCAPPLLSLYLRWGWELLETKIIRGETRHFLLFVL
jgi:hypothetical protein